MQLSEKRMVRKISLPDSSLMFFIWGVCYLYMKVIERSHYPRRLWEKVKLSKNMQTALDQVRYLRWLSIVCFMSRSRRISFIGVSSFGTNVRLDWFASTSISSEWDGWNSKQGALLLHLNYSVLQYSTFYSLIFRQQKIITLPRKTERREKRREEKALIAAKLDTAIEKELLNRLKSALFI